MRHTFFNALPLNLCTSLLMQYIGFVVVWISREMSCHLFVLDVFENKSSKNSFINEHRPQYTHFQKKSNLIDLMDGHTREMSGSMERKQHLGTCNKPTWHHSPLITSQSFSLIHVLDLIRIINYSCKLIVLVYIACKPNLVTPLFCVLRMLHTQDNYTIIVI